MIRRFLAITLICFGCASPVPLRVQLTDCVHNTVSDAAVYKIEHPEANLFAVVGISNNGKAYHVEPVDIQSDSHWILFGYDAGRLWINDNGKDAISKLIIGDIKVYPMEWFVKTCTGHSDIKASQLQIYWAFDSAI